MAACCKRPNRPPRGSWNSLRVLRPARRCAVLMRAADAHRLLRCAWCTAELTKDTAQVDHVQPRVEDGGDGVDKLVPCCPPCNEARRHGRLGERLVRSAGGGQPGDLLKEAWARVRSILAVPVDLEAGAALAAVWYDWEADRLAKNRERQKVRDAAKRARWRLAKTDPARTDFPYGHNAPGAAQAA